MEKKTVKIIDDLRDQVKKLEFQLRDKTNGLMYEDELPDEMTKKDWNLWYKTSKIVDGVRMGNIFPKINSVEGGAEELKELDELITYIENDLIGPHENIKLIDEGIKKYAELYHTSQMKNKFEKVKEMAKVHLALDALIIHWAQEGIIKESEWEKATTLCFKNKDADWITNQLTKEDE